MSAFDAFFTRMRESISIISRPVECKQGSSEDAIAPAEESLLCSLKRQGVTLHIEDDTQECCVSTQDEISSAGDDARSAGVTQGSFRNAVELLNPAGKSNVLCSEPLGFKKGPLAGCVHYGEVPAVVDPREFSRLREVEGLLDGVVPLGLLSWNAVEIGGRAGEMSAELADLLGSDMSENSTYVMCDVEGGDSCGQSEAELGEDAEAVLRRVGRRMVTQGDLEMQSMEDETTALLGRESAGAEKGAEAKADSPYLYYRLTRTNWQSKDFATLEEMVEFIKQSFQASGGHAGIFFEGLECHVPVNEANKFRRHIARLDCLRKDDFKGFIAGAVGATTGGVAAGILTYLIGVATGVEVVAEGAGVGSAAAAAAGGATPAVAAAEGAAVAAGGATVGVGAAAEGAVAAGGVSAAGASSTAMTFFVAAVPYFILIAGGILIGVVGYKLISRAMYKRVSSIVREDDHMTTVVFNFTHLKEGEAH